MNLSKEFYFCAFEIDNEIQVAVTPKMYFDYFGYMFDDHIAGYIYEEDDLDEFNEYYQFVDADDVLPEGWEEVMEGFFAPEDPSLTLEEVKQIFLKHNFIQNDNFDEVVKNGFSE